MCWKYELAKAHNNLTRAILFVGRAKDKLEKRGNQEGFNSTSDLIHSLEQDKEEIRQLIKVYGISHKPESAYFKKLMGDTWQDEKKHPKNL